MGDIDTVIAYHDRTKHDFGRYAASPGYLDWANQPDPFRRFDGSTLTPLLLADDADSPPYDNLFHPGNRRPRPMDGTTVSRFFELSLALSAWKQFNESRWALRINPSSGNLHPTEGYLVCEVIPEFCAAGVYHYAPREHALEMRRELPNELAKELLSGFPDRTFLAALTSLHWREAWKYGERAFRYCQHDVGHAAAAMALAAAELGWSVRPLDALGDDDIAALLGLDRASDFEGAEREEPDLILAVMPTNDGQGLNALPDASLRGVSALPTIGRANALSAEHADWPVIDEVARAARKPRGALIVERSARTSVQSTPGNAVHPLLQIDPSPGARTGMCPPYEWGDSDASQPRAVQTQCTESGESAEPRAATIIRQRRSAVSMDRRTSVPFDRFLAMLARTVPSAGTPPWNAIAGSPCIDLLLFVHRVTGLEPGLYLLPRASERRATWESLLSSKLRFREAAVVANTVPLVELAKGDARALATQLSCHQEIAGDGAFSCGMLAAFESTLRRHGAWWYRRLFWEAGTIGQVLYLEAEAAGLRGTGIGCYFDDALHRLLGLTDHAFQSLYHFTVGGAVEDLRLMTWPPYDQRVRGRSKG